MIVSHEHGFIFLKTRKTAGTSVEIALSAVCGDRDVLTRLSPGTDEPERLRLTGRTRQNDAFPMHAHRPRDWARLAARGRRRTAYNHMPAAEVRELVGRRVFDGYRKIAVTRNPFDVALSMYHYLNRHGGFTFAEFLRDPKCQSWYADNYGIVSLGGSLVVDPVCRFSHLSDDFADVVSRLGLDGCPALTHAKRTVSADLAQRRSAYTPEDVALVERLCAAELDAFGYAFDDSAD